MDSTPLRNVPSLQSALANAFCYLISSMDDPNVYVAQRATLYLGTIHDAAVKVTTYRLIIAVFINKSMFVVFNNVFRNTVRYCHR